MPKIHPMLWFDGQAEEAANLYVSVFPNSKIGSISRYPEGAPHGTPGQAMTVEFNLDGQRFTALNGGPMFKLTEAISFVVPCASQDEVDYYWNALTADGGQESQCAWLKDKFGVSWQIVPDRLVQLLNDADKAKAQRVMQAMLQMRKIVIADLEAAAAG
jgi:predicted 3-demethylubiquinone-9 3-methyltransferase (glyoxalase superfamily)